MSVTDEQLVADGISFFLAFPHLHHSFVRVHIQ